MPDFNQGDQLEITKKQKRKQLDHMSTCVMKLPHSNVGNPIRSSFSTATASKDALIKFSTSISVETAVLLRLSALPKHRNDSKRIIIKNIHV